MTTYHDGPECWTGLAEVRGNPGNGLLAANKYAFARLFGVATDADDFISRANEMLRHYELEVIGFTQVQQVIQGKLYGETEERFKELVSQAAKVKGPLLATFHEYPSQDEG